MLCDLLRRRGSKDSISFTIEMKQFFLASKNRETAFPGNTGAFAGERTEKKKKAGRLSSRRITIEPVRCLGNLCILSKFFFIGFAELKTKCLSPECANDAESFLWDLFIENDFIWKHFGLSHFCKNRSEQWIFYRLFCSSRIFGFEPLFSVSHIIVKILCYTLGIKPITVPWGSSTS